MSKVILITGGSSGIGKSIALLLHQEGYKVYGTSRNPERYKETIPFEMVALDVANSESVLSCVSSILDKEGRIDVLINNAGIGITGPIEETPIEEMEQVFATNFYGPIRLTNAVLPAMRKQNKGQIINITSIAGYMGLPYRGIYSATKAALEMLTEAQRMEVKHFGVSISNIAPGDFATNIASGRYHSPVLENSPYKKPYEDTLALMNAHVDEGKDPLAMANAVLKIIKTKNPKVHYKVGSFLQKFSIVLKRILPDTVYEKMLMKHYKL